MGELIALKNSGYVASDWPRYWGRKPKRIMRPLPMVTWTRAALPLRRSAPSSQPERSGSLSRGYQAITFTADAGVPPVGEPSLTVGLLPRWPSSTSNTGEFSAQAIDSFGIP